jgi:hypothetical protein
MGEGKRANNLRFCDRVLFCKFVPANLATVLLLVVAAQICFGESLINVSFID